MIAACEQAGVALMEAFMYRLHPLWRQVRALVDGGAVGDLLTIQSFFSYRNTEPDNIRNIAHYGGGALMDIGCYPINVARWMFDGEPDGVVATVLRDPTFGTDVLTSAVLDFGGRQATFTCSTQIEDDQRVHLIGTAGRLLVEIPFNIPPDRPTRIVAGGGRRPTGRARHPGHRGADSRPLCRAGRRVLDSRAGRLAGSVATRRCARQHGGHRTDPRGG